MRPLTPPPEDIEDDGLRLVFRGAVLIVALGGLACIIALGCVGPANAPSPADYFRCGDVLCHVAYEECSSGLPRRCIPSWRDIGRSAPDAGSRP